MRRDLVSAGIEPTASNFYRFTKGERKGEWDLRKSFRMQVARKMGWTIDLRMLHADLDNSNAMVIIEAKIFQDNDVTKKVGHGIASATCTDKTLDFAYLGQKASTWAIKSAIDMAMGLTDEDVQEMAHELGLDKKSGFKHQTSEPEPEAPAEMPAEDESLNEELFG
jgi:hypothetical protein